MSMRISKYQPLFGVGLDMHGKLPGVVPPAPAPVLVPKSPWAVIIAAPWAAAWTGKWSLQSVQTEGMGNILWGYDWGMGQVHIPVTPHYGTPSIAILVIASTTKYFLPSFSVKERVDGGALAGSGESAVAVSTPIFLIPTQQCWDVGCAVSFVFPSSICFQQVSARWVGFNFGDFMAGVIGMAGDALAAFILSKFGGNLIPGKWDDALLGGLASSFMGHGANLMNLLPDWAKVVQGGAGVFAGILSYAAEFGMLLEKAPIGGAAAFLLAPLVGWAGGQAAEAVGDRWGSKESGPPVPPPSSGGTGGPDAGPSGTGGTTGGPDAGTGGSDGGTGGPDAGTGGSDGGTGGPDAGPSSPDAGPGSPDADPGGPVCEPPDEPNSSQMPPGG